MVAVDGQQDILHEERSPDLGDGPQLPSLGASILKGKTDDPHIPQQLRSRAHEIFFFCTPSDDYRRRQFLLMKNDDDIIGSPSDRINGRLVGNMEEFQRIAGDLDFKTAVGGRNGSYLKLGHAELDVFDRFTFFIDNAAFDADTLLRQKHYRQQQSCRYKPNPHRYPPPFQHLPDRVGSPGYRPAGNRAPCRAY